MLTIADYDRRIARLRRILKEENRKLRRAKQELYWSDPARCAAHSIKVKAALKKSPRALPEMTKAERALYDNAKQHYHMSRADALAFAKDSTGRSPTVLPVPRKGARPVLTLPRGLGA